MPTLIVIFVMVDDPIKSYILFTTIVLGSLVIVIEMARLYYSGVNL